MSWVAVSLHCVFHSISFKVNKVGIRRYPFFYVPTRVVRSAMCVYTLPVCFHLSTLSYVSRRVRRSFMADAMSCLTVRTYALA